MKSLFLIVYIVIAVLVIAFILLQGRGQGWAALGAEEGKLSQLAGEWKS